MSSLLDVVIRSSNSEMSLKSKISQYDEDGKSKYGHGYGHSSCSIECSCMHKCLSRISSIFQCSLSSETIRKSSFSSSSFSRLTYVFRVHLQGGHCRVSMWFCNHAVLAGNGISSVGVSSSSEELKVKCHCTGL